MSQSKLLDNACGDGVTLMLCKEKTKTSSAVNGANHNKEKSMSTNEANVHNRTLGRMPKRSAVNKNLEELAQREITETGTAPRIDRFESPSGATTLFGRLMIFDRIKSISRSNPPTISLGRTKRLNHKRTSARSNAHPRSRWLNAFDRSKSNDISF